MCVHMCSPPLITRTTFLYKIEGNWVVIILHFWSWYTSVGKNILVVTIYKDGILAWDSKHPYLITKSLYKLNSLIHWNKLASRGTCFTWILLLGHPINWKFIQENNKSRSWSPSNSVFSLINIHIYSHPESQYSGIRHSPSLVPP